MRLAILGCDRIKKPLLFSLHCVFVTSSCVLRECSNVGCAGGAGGLVPCRSVRSFNLAARLLCLFDRPFHHTTHHSPHVTHHSPLTTHRHPAGGLGMSYICSCIVASSFAAISHLQWRPRAISALLHTLHCTADSFDAARGHIVPRYRYIHS